MRILTSIFNTIFIAIFVILMSAGLLGQAQNVNVSVGVLGLFHPLHFVVTPVAGSALVVHVGADALVLETSSGVSSAKIRLHGENEVVDIGGRILRGSTVTVTGRDGGPVEFNLAVPGRITRRYQGVLELKPQSGALIAIVTMDLETAVASVVAAEGAADTPAEALKALAVAARSYFMANKGRHRDYDFCDTTHCQFLRTPPSSASPAAQAASSTRGLVIVYQSQTVGAMYTRSCSGHTHTPAELGLPSSAYPYYAVECRYCRQHPSRWQSRISAEDAASLRSSNEPSRLQVGRHLGWSVVPSNDFVVRKEGDHILLRGIGQGHGIGLCQAGATAMAEDGSDFRKILSYYYPNTVVTALAASSSARNSIPAASFLWGLRHFPDN
ncbi:MAG: SpoIID/LytB domain-containing protein [Terriglobales bacterium]